MRWLRARRPIWLLANLWLLLYFDHTGLVRVGILAALLHESGHVLAWLLLTKTPPVLRLHGGGIALDASAWPLTRKQTFILAAAGPLSNLLFCGGTLLLMQHRASYWGYFFAAANLALALFNLLPFGMLDGKRLLAALRR